jgi:pimeloyl-ACP methyl ester carboxylesterase
MAPVSDVAVHSFPADDGLELAYRTVGEGRPVILIHGFTGDGPQLIEHGPVRTLAEHDFRVILPDLRGHGTSAHPHDPSAYPPDALAGDGLALVAHLGLDDYDLAGYSLGGRVVVRMLARGARPRRAVVAGQGLDAIRKATTRTGRFRRVLAGLAAGETFEPGSPEANMAQWLDRPRIDPAALALVLDTHHPTPEAALHDIPTPTLVVVGDEDHDHDDGDQLAALLPRGRFSRVPGAHGAAMAAPEFAAVMVEFLTADR